MKKILFLMLMTVTTVSVSAQTSDFRSLDFAYVDLNDKIAYLSGNVGAGGATKFLEINAVRDVFDQTYQFHLPKV